MAAEGAVPAADYKGKKAESNWLPNEAFSKAWQDFVKTGRVSDNTPPPTPTDVKFDAASNTVTWKAEADYESGLAAFFIERDGKEVGRVPEKKRNKFGQGLFQGMTYGDTPQLPLAGLRFVDKAAEPGKQHAYRVISVNTAGLKSRSE
jgi:hypothetical protein